MASTENMLLGLTVSLYVTGLLCVKAMAASYWNVCPMATSMGFARLVSGVAAEMERSDALAMKDWGCVDATAVRLR